jgi:hypothetical protein
MRCLVVILLVLIAACAAQIQIMPTLMICGSASNSNIFTQCNLWNANNSSNTIGLSVRPVRSAPYCNEINFGDQIVVNGSATISCSIATQAGPYQYAISMYDPTFAGAFTSNVGFPFFLIPGKTWTFNFGPYQEWINNKQNQLLNGYQYVSNSYTWNNFQVTGSIFMNFGQAAIKPDASLLRNLDKVYAV